MIALTTRKQYIGSRYRFSIYIANSGWARQQDVSSDNSQHQELLSDLVRLHILHHAAEGKLYGHWMIEELRRHGYRISPGTLYPMLHALERKGYLKSRTEGKGRRARRVYRATPKGRKALAAAKDRVRELFGELMEGR